MSGFLRRQVEENVLQAHPHRPQFEESPALVHHGGGQSAANVMAARDLDFQADHRATGVGDAGACDARHDGQRRLHVATHGVHLHVYRFRATHPRCQVVRRVHGYHAALADDDDALAGLTHLGQDVGAQDDRVVAGQVLDELSGFDDLLRVESGSGLVQDQDVRFVDQGLGQADALLVALGQSAALSFGHVGHVNLLHHAVNPRLDFSPGHALNLRNEGQIVAHPHVRVEGRSFREVAGSALGLDGLFQYVEPGHRDLPLSGRHVAGEHSHGRGFSGAVRAQESKNLAGLHAEADVVNGRDGAVPLREVFYLDHRLISGYTGNRI